MNNQTDLKFVKPPFFIAAFFCGAALFGFAYVYLRHAHAPLGVFEALAFLFCGELGAAALILPFWLDYRAAVRMVETGAAVSTISQLQNIEELAKHINTATSQWHGVQEHSAKTAMTAKEIADRMAGEMSAFSEFLKKANDSERATLRMEIEKLRRAEGDWLQIIVRMLDHTFALYQAAARSGQSGLIEQLGHFQNACREVARRVGLVPFVPTPGENLDPQIHQLHDPNAKPEPGAKVGDVIATGYTYQGQLLRPALVSLQVPQPVAAATIVETSAPAPAIAEVTESSPQKEPVMQEQTLL